MVVSSPGCMEQFSRRNPAERFVLDDRN